MSKYIRQPIITVLGHIDHGKTTLLDAIRGTTYQKKEAGGITQHIGATEVPKEVIENVSGKILKAFKFELKIPGILFIDTPGHAAFLSLRERGTSIADLAVLVVDIMQGLQEQTYESLNILKTYKVPFLVAATKIDMIPGWKPQNTYYFLESIQKQEKQVVDFLEQKLYNIVAQLMEQGFDAERFDRVKDFRRTVAIVPVSGVTKEGIAELLALIAGLSQRFLEKRLYVNPEERAKGVILEVKEEKGLGKVIDAIIYDGILREGELLAIPTLNGIKITKVRAIFRPKPLQETRFKGKLVRVKEVSPAAGVRILLKDPEGIIAGVPFISIKEGEKVEEISPDLVKFTSKIVLHKKDVDGVIAKADTLGTLEGLIRLLQQENIPIRKTGIGNVNKEDVLEAKSVRDKNKFLGVIFAFNVDVEKEAEELARKEGIKIFKGNVVYRLIENYKEWVKEEKEREEKELFEKLTLPCKFRIIPGFVFRQYKPAIVGVEILVGVLKPGVTVMKPNGRKIGVVRSIQYERKSLPFAKKGDRVAVAIDGAYIGRNVKEGEELIVDIPEEDFKIIKQKFLSKLSEEEKELLRLVASIHRKTKPDWGL